MWELVTQWFVGELEKAVRHDLVRDYLELADELPVARGRIIPMAATRLFYAGRLAVDCEFDGFGFDTPVNRLLKAGARGVSASPLLSSDLRRRAIGLLARIDDVGPLQPSDLSARTDRRTNHSRSTLVLARHIVQGEGRTIAAGRDLAWTFLIPTPRSSKLIFVRSSWIDFGPARVTKEGNFNGGLSVGDVKYKVVGNDWLRADLYQVVAFAEAFSTNVAALFGFAGPETPALNDLVVGQKWIPLLAWPADPELLPADAAAQLCAETQRWFQEAGEEAVA